MTEFDDLLQQHLQRLHAFVRLQAGPVLLGKESSSDLTQSVCRELLTHKARFAHGDEEGFRRWLYTTARRKIADRYDFYQAQKRDGQREEADSSVDGRALLSAYASFCTPSRHAEAKEELARVERCFQQLSREKQEVILLARVARLPRAVIAEELGKSEGAVRTLLYRALGDLADQLVDGESE